MWDLFMICIGVLIGWNLPQPELIKSLQNKLVAAIKRFVNSLGGPEEPAPGDRPRNTDPAQRRDRSDGQS